MAPPTRQSGARAAATRPLPRTQATGRLHIDKSKVPPNKVYAWVRESMLNEHDPANVQNRLMEGWTAVPADRHSELVPPVLPGEEDTAPKATLIRRGGLLLMECLKQDWRERAEVRAQDNYEQMQTVARATGDLNDDPRMPNQTYFNETGIERVTSEFRE
jgi:hypothetical protein